MYVKYSAMMGFLVGRTYRTAAKIFCIYKDNVAEQIVMC